MATVGRIEAHQPLMEDFKVGDGKESLAVDFDELDAPPAAPQESRWSRWRGRVISLVGVGASVAIRVINYSRWTNAVGLLGVGAFAQSFIESGYTGETLARIRQVSLTVFGQVALFGMSQAFANTEDPAWKMYLTHAIIAQLGANIEIAARWLFQQGAVRVESNALPGQRGQKMVKAQCFNHNLSHGMKVISSAVSGVLYFKISDPILKGFASFISSFYTSQVIGERIIDWLDHKIEKNDSSARSLSGADGGTRYRRAKTALITLGYAAQPLSFTPWYDPDTGERIRQLFYVGISLGFFNGVADQSEIRRMERIPIEDLEEFHKLTPPSQSEDGTFRRCRHVAYRVFVYAVPIVSAGGIIGFTLWQELKELKGNDSKIAIGAMLGGFLGGYSFSRAVDWAWNPNKRHFFRDNAMISLWASPRIAGINPLFIYYAGTNALRMDGTAIDSQVSPYHQAAIITAWLAYGASMGRELHITASDRVGNPQLKCPRMLLVNGVITTKLSISGVNP